MRLQLLPPPDLRPLDGAVQYLDARVKGLTVHRVGVAVLVAVGPLDREVLDDEFTC